MNRLSLLFNLPLETFCPFLGCCPIQRLGLQSCCRAGPRKAGQHLFILGDCLCLLCVTRQKLVTTPELQMDVRGFREAAQHKRRTCRKADSAGPIAPRTGQVFTLQLATPLPLLLIPSPTAKPWGFTDKQWGRRSRDLDTRVAGTGSNICPTQYLLVPMLLVLCFEM